MKFASSVVLALVFCVGMFYTMELGASPYSRAHVTVFKQLDGVEKVLGSKIVSVFDESVPQYSDTADYMNECTTFKKESKCSIESASIGVLARVTYEGGALTAPFYKINVGWQELVDLSSFEEDGVAIDLPTVINHSFAQRIEYTQPVEFKANVSSKTSLQDNIIVRVKLIE